MNTTVTSSARLILSHANGLIVFVFFLLTFLVWGGTGYSIAVALLLSPLAIWLGNDVALTQRHKQLAYALLAMFLMHYWFEFRGDDLKYWEFDHPSRFLLIIPILFLFSKIQYPKAYFWAGVFIAGVACGYESYTFTGSRVRGPFNPIIWGNIALVIFLFSCVRVLSVAIDLKKEYQLKRLAEAVAWLIPISGTLMGIAGSGSRGAWLTILLLLALGVIYLVSRLGILKATVIALMMLMLVTLAYLTPHTKIKPRVDKAIAELAEFELGKGKATSTGLRLEMWYTSIVAFAENPLLGKGKAGLNELEQRLFEEEKVHKWVVSESSQQHSDFFDTLAKGGLLGVAVLAFFYLSLFRFANVFEDKSTQWMIRLLMIGYIGFGLTNAILVGMNGTMFLLGAIVALAGMKSSGKLQTNEQSASVSN